MKLKSVFRLSGAVLIAACFFIGISGCQTAVKYPKIKMKNTQRIAIVPFMNYSDGFKAKIAGEASETVQVDEYLTGKLIELLEKKEFNDIRVLPKVAKKGTRLFHVEKIRETVPGDADVLVIGRIYRFRDRRGRSYAVSAPASVALDIRLVNVETGETINHFEYNETQRALSENILKIKDFIKRKGRWVHAIELAESGIAEGVGKITE